MASEVQAGESLGQAWLGSPMALEHPSPDPSGVSDNTWGSIGFSQPAEPGKHRDVFLRGVEEVCSSPKDHLASAAQGIPCIGNSLSSLVLLAFAPFSVWLQAAPTFSSGATRTKEGEVWAGFGVGMEQWVFSVLAVGLMSMVGLLFLASGGSISLAAPFRGSPVPWQPHSLAAPFPSPWR